MQLSATHCNSRSLKINEKRKLSCKAWRVRPGQQAGGTESAFFRKLDASVLQLVCALSQACHVVSCEVVCCRCLLLLLRRCCRCCCCLMLPAVVLPRLLLLSTAAACFRCCFFLFFFQICPKCSQNGPATQPQLSATQLQLSRVANHTFQALELHISGSELHSATHCNSELPDIQKTP